MQPVPHSAPVWVTREGDRILVGTSIIKVVAVEGQVAQQSEAEARRRLEAGAQQRQATQGRPMSGVIEEIPLPDLLQLLSTSRKSGVATLILRELETWARDLGFGRCILETGKKQPEAIALYLKNGYALIENYGQYAGVENSLCFEKKLRDH